MKTIKHIFQLRLTSKEVVRSKQILALIMVPLFVFQMSSLNLAFINVAKAEGETLDAVMSPASDDSEEVDNEDDGEEEEQVASQDNPEEGDGDATQQSEEEASGEENTDEVNIEDKNGDEEGITGDEAEGTEEANEENPVITPEAIATTTESEASIEASTEASEEETKTEDETVAEEPEWQMDGNKATIGPVELDKTYKAPQNEKVTITFTELPDEPGNLSVEEITLSDEQVAELGALSNKAYDITSDMENGTFEYDLTLPKPDNVDDVQIKYAEDESELDEARVVENVDVRDDKVKADELDHFTVFVVVSGKDQTNLLSPEVLNASSISKISASDDDRYLTNGHWPQYWVLPYQQNQYLEFTFSPNVPGDAIINSAKLVFEYQRDALKSGTSQKDARIRAWDGDGFDVEIADYNDLKLSSPDKDETKIISIPSELVNTPEKINNFKIRFYMRGVGPILHPWLKTKHDYVGLDIDYVNPGSITIIKDAIPNNSQQFRFNGGSLVSFDLDDDGDNNNGLSNTKVFSSLTPGNYTITEPATPGWSLTDINCSGGSSVDPKINNRNVVINLGSGENVTCTFTNTKDEYCGNAVTDPGEQCDDGGVIDGDGCSATCQFENGSISGIKWEDMNANGVRDAEDGAISGWTIKLDKNGDGSIDQTTTTDANGVYVFENLIPGIYKVQESTPYPWNVSYPDSGVASYTGINVNAGDNLTGYDFGNYKNARIEGYKWIDENGNGVKDGNEGAPSNQWQIKLWKDDGNGTPVDTGSTSFTQTSGYFGFGVKPGTYYLSEVFQTGWKQTFPGSNGFWGPIVVTSGQTVTDNDFGNQYVGICGDKTIDIYEQCDDGNLIDNDGCSASCQIEDMTPPSVPTEIYFKDTVNNKDVQCGEFTSARNFDVHWNANNDDPDFDHYEYISFNADGSTGPIRTFTTNYFNASWWTVPIEGTYGVQVRAVDTAGNKSEWSGGSQGIENSCTYIADWTKPTKPEFSSPENNSITNINYITLNWTGGDDTGSGVKGYIFRYVFYPANGGTAKNWTSGFVSGTQKTRSGSFGHGEGRYEMYVKVVDNAGNESLESDPLTITYDASKPTATINYNPSTLTNGNVIATLVPNESVTIINNSGSDTYTFTQNGSFTFEFKDAAGNTGTALAEVNYIDKDAPYVEITNPTSSLLTGTVEVRGTVTDDHPHHYWLYITRNGSQIVNKTVNQSDSFTNELLYTLTQDGDYEVTLAARDAAGGTSSSGNRSANVTKTFTIDNTAPDFSLSGIKYPNGTIQDKYVTNWNTPAFVGNLISSDVASVKVLVNSAEYVADINGTEWSAAISSVLADGSYDMQVIATDLAGNQTTITKTLVIDTKVPTATHAYYKDGNLITDSIAYVNNIGQLSFTGEYIDETPSSGLYWDSYVIFEAQDDHSFRFSANGKKSFCGWRTAPNLLDISDEATFSQTEKVPFNNCVASLSDGEYYLAHHIYDSATRKDIPSINQFKDVLGLHFVVDSTGPSVPVLTWPIDGMATNNNSPLMQWDDSNDGNGSGVAGYYYRVYYNCSDESNIPDSCSGVYPNADGLWRTSSEYQAGVTSNGIYYWQVRAKDNLGNFSNWSDFEKVVIDTVKPSSIITSPANEDNNSIIYSSSWDGSVAGTASDVLSGLAEVKISIQEDVLGYWNGSGWQAGEYLLTATGTDLWNYSGLSSPEEGTYTIKSHAVDNAGNVENTYTLTIVFDKTIPEVSLTIDPSNPDGDNNWYISTPTITLKATDANFDRIEYMIDSGSWIAYSTPVKIDDGKHIFYYRAFDKAGNESGTGIKNVKVDTEDPDKVSDLDAEYNEDKDAVKLTWDADDDDIHKVYIYRGGSRGFHMNSGSLIGKNDDNDETFNDDDAERGEKYYYKLVSRDEAGNKSGAKVISVEITEEGNAIVTDEGVDNSSQGSGSGEEQSGGSEEGQQGEEIQGASDEGGTTLGEETQKGGENAKRTFWIIFFLALLGLILYLLYRRRKNRIANEPQL